MDAFDYFRGLFEYDDWASREARASLDSVSGPVEGPLKLLAHAVGAQRRDANGRPKLGGDKTVTAFPPRFHS